MFRVKPLAAFYILTPEKKSQTIFRKSSDMCGSGRQLGVNAVQNVYEGAGDAIGNKVYWWWDSSRQ